MATTLTYFSLLGLSEDAGPDELEARYQALADYFASPGIPASLREWASRQAALVDEAYAVLADPERRAAAIREQRLPSETARAAPADTERQQNAWQPDEPGDRGREQRRPAPTAAGQTEPGGLRLLDFLRSHRLVLGALIGLVVLGTIFLAGYGLPGGGGGGQGVPSTTAQNSVPLDTGRVAQLMTIVQEDPSNKDALFELGERYFEANQWQTSIDWLTKLIAVDPSNTFAMTDIGTANFNLGQPDVAKTTWLQVLKIDPNYVQAHYNLGFLYANVEPQDLASARREWETVVQLAPESDLASTAQVHLSGLLAQTPTAAVAGTTPSPP